MNIWPVRLVPLGRRRFQTDHQHRSTTVAERRPRTSPVGLISESGAALAASNALRAIRPVEGQARRPTRTPAGP